MMKIKIKTKYRIMYTNEFKIGIKIGSQGPIEIPFFDFKEGLWKE